MPAVRPLTPDDFSLAHETFLSTGDSRNVPENYRPMFDPVVSHGGNLGYSLWDGDQLVGMLGTLVSQRTFGESISTVCNLHSWYVLPEYRGYSLLLMRPVLRETEWTLTDFSPTEAVVAISQRLGFELLDSRMTTLAPVRRLRVETSVTVLTNRDAIATHVSVRDSTVVSAIGDSSLTPLWFNDGASGCLILARRVTRDCRPHCRIHYVSEVEFFARHSGMLVQHLLNAVGGEFVALENRLLAGRRLPNSRTHSLSLPQLIRPAKTRRPEVVDTLRSELQFTGMATLPGKRLYLQSWTNRIRAFANSWRR